LRVCLWPAHAHRRWATRRRCISADARRLLPCTKAQEYSQRAQLVLRPSGVFQAGRGLSHACRRLEAGCKDTGRPACGPAPLERGSVYGQPPVQGRPSRASVICNRPFVSRSSFVQRVRTRMVCQGRSRTTRPRTGRQHRRTGAGEGEGPMPHLQCPRCRVSQYSAPSRSRIADACPVCGASLEAAMKRFPAHVAGGARQ
jgi:hypothetical protein